MTASVLPVVAMRLIPHIYRRAAFPHRATPEVLPLAMVTALWPTLDDWMRSRLTSRHCRCRK